MDINLSLDEIIERKRKTDKKFFTPNRTAGGGSGAAGRGISNLNRQSKPYFKPAAAAAAGAPGIGGIRSMIGDARNKIIAKNRAKIVDARDVLINNTHAAGFDARQRLQERGIQKTKRILDEEDDMPPAQTSYKIQFPNRINANNNKVKTFMPNYNDARVQFKRNVSVAGIGARTEPYKFVAHGMDYKPPRPAYQRTKLPTPRGYVDYDNMQELEDEEYKRTVTHLGYLSDHDDDDLELRVTGCRKKSSPPPPPSPPMPSSSSSRPLGRFTSWNQNNGSSLVNDPFDIYESAQRNRIERPTMYDQCIADENITIGISGKRISSELRARLNSGVPDRRISQGIYGNENTAISLMLSRGNSYRLGIGGGAGAGAGGGGGGSDSSTSSAGVYNGFRIVVSNLHSGVSTDDIKELFAEIGPMFDARVVRPGTAEVIFKTLADAERAVDMYHNRQLDGQPMKCMLVNPRSSNRPTAPAVTTKSATSKSNFQVDIDALHSVLFGDR